MEVLCSSSELRRWQDRSWEGQASDVQQVYTAVEQQQSAWASAGTGSVTSGAHMPDGRGSVRMRSE